MNPINLLKALYETFGTPYPRLSLVVVTILGAVLFAGVWQFAAKQVQKEHTASTPTVSRPASTTGNESPAVTGNGNDIKYEQPPPPEQKPSK